LLYAPTAVHHTVKGDFPNPRISRRFALLCWNVNKRRNPGEHRKQMEAWLKEWRIELIFLQEARFRPGTSFLLPGFGYNAAANLQVGQRYYGVLTASKTEAEESLGRLSRGREGFIGPRKSLLVERYPGPDGQRLLSVNLHGINFRESRRFHREMEHLKDLLRSHRGPMLVAGDFNSWNRSRQEQLARFARELDLHLLETDGKKVKSFMGHPLDLVFYRGLRLLRSEVPDLPELSDHNPILAEFEFL